MDPNTLNFTLPPASLSKMCTVKIATAMVNSVLLNKGPKCLVDETQESVDVKNGLMTNVKSLKLPAKITLYLKNYAHFVLSETCSWYRGVMKICFSGILTSFIVMPLTNEVLGYIAWTGRGKIDHEQTARNYASIPNFSFEIRYRLACAFHLEDLVRQLWKENSTECQRFNINEEKESLEIVYWSFKMIEISDEEILYYLKRKYRKLRLYNSTMSRTTTSYIVNQLNVPQTQLVYTYALVCSFYNDKPYSIRYFGTKCEERYKTAIFKSIDVSLSNLKSDGAFLFYSTMDQLGLESLIEQNGVFDIFSQLPFELFVRIFRNLKSVIEEKDFIQVLFAIADHHATVWEDYVSPLEMNWDSVFYDIWINQVPESYRTWVLDQIGNEFYSVTNLLKTLFQSGHHDSVDLLLRNQPQNRLEAFCSVIMEDLKGSDELEFALERALELRCSEEWKEFIIMLLAM